MFRIQLSYLATVRKCITEDSIELITTLFGESNGIPPSVNFRRFKADHPRWLDKLNQQSAWHVPIKFLEAERCRVLGFALPLINHGRVDQILQCMEQIFFRLQNHYRKNLNEKVSFDELIENCSFDEIVLKESLCYLSDLHNIWSGLPKEFPCGEEVWIIVNENILKYEHIVGIFNDYYLTQYVDQPRKSQVDEVSEQVGSSLHPLDVALSIVFRDFNSQDIQQLIDSLGISIDWSLTEKQDYSHQTRKRVYRQRLSKVCISLDEPSRINISVLIFRFLLEKGKGLSGEVEEQLSNIGWMYDGRNLIPGSPKLREMLFPSGAVHDAYIKIREILAQSQKELRIIDPYIDESLFVMLKVLKNPIKISVLTGRNLPRDFKIELRKFIEQYKVYEIEIRTTHDFHDRFIIVDQRDFYHLGASIKDAGKKVFMLHLIEDKSNTLALAKSLDESWGRGKKV